MHFSFLLCGVWVHNWVYIDGTHRKRNPPSHVRVGRRIPRGELREYTPCVCIRLHFVFSSFTSFRRYAVRCLLLTTLQPLTTAPLRSPPNCAMRWSCGHRRLRRFFFCCLFVCLLFKFIFFRLICRHGLFVWKKRVWDPIACFFLVFLLFAVDLFCLLRCERVIGQRALRSHCRCLERIMVAGSAPSLAATQWQSRQRKEEVEPATTLLISF